jgi:hypothetical protein
MICPFAGHLSWRDPLGVAEHGVYHRFRQCAQALQRFG